MEIQKPHLSVSAMGMLARCGEQYRRRYIEGDKLPPGIAALVGRGVDQTVTANLQAVIDGLQLLPVEQLADLARDAVNNEFSAGEVALTEEEAANPKAAKGSAVDKAIRLSWLHGESVAPKLKPVSVQRKWRLGIENFPFDLLGFIDVEEEVRLRDTKTTGRTPPWDAAHTSDQLTMYAFAKRQIDGAAPRSVHLDYLVDSKRGGPKSVTLDSKREDADFSVLLRRVEASANMIEKQIFLPAPQDSWVCHPRWCGYWSSCPFARRSARPEN